MRTETSRSAPPPRPLPELLIAVGANPHHQFGVQFAASFFHDFDSIRFRLIHLLPPEQAVVQGPYGVLLEGGRMDEALYRQHERQGMESLEYARATLCGAGVPEEHVTLVSRPQEQGKALDLIRESAQNNHHALVLGKRGRSWLESTLDGIPDITGEIIDATCGVPLWVAPDALRKRRNILLCLDGSQQCMNMARHVGRTVGSQGNHSITMLRVLRDRHNNPVPPEIMFSQCRDVLESEGVPSDAIRMRVVTDNNPADAILSTCDRGKFAVIAMGRAGYGNSFLRRLLIGSVSMSVLRRLQNACLWLSC